MTAEELRALLPVGLEEAARARLLEAVEALEAQALRASEEALDARIEAELRRCGASRPEEAAARLDRAALLAAPDEKAAVREAVRALSRRPETAALFGAVPTGQVRDACGTVRSAPAPDDMDAVRAAAGLLAPFPRP